MPVDQVGFGVHVVGLDVHPHHVPQPLGEEANLRATSVLRRGAVGDLVGPHVPVPLGEGPQEVALLLLPENREQEPSSRGDEVDLRDPWAMLRDDDVGAHDVPRRTPGPVGPDVEREQLPPDRMLPHPIAVQKPDQARQSLLHPRDEALQLQHGEAVFDSHLSPLGCPLVVEHVDSENRKPVSKSFLPNNL
ncbi:MAG: hypothetical protein COV59_04995 [Candidatus Magasanikbacteria bacterium CG11_big_fil_rev_8_21_14_0_20_39_34]|uniref:Uncharacterized protein n=1 Tax=Candidatus Magasanikbacteria bacterium CG11_big_fil_rev_8_21_14_0_20_39_34 TaxID=1974653 RepID=A0A2H0N3Q2_9BACT|nr:MAG: hypothetical protein COV59_04995 [Candidatus Magasanikbacteria bacterium CG11_big_fil_rev_8_21_14_0_20_39_34]